jgi:prepilin-type N-terminal cleavage/methylation domain-containing protein/prepilin-type processing-associated H-X9-DG protein
VKDLKRSEEFMRKKKGFTLVELLVVIAIIALLLSVLMPSLGKARLLARRVICQAQLKQWSTVFQVYANSNDGKNHNFWPSGQPGDTFNDHYLKRCAVELFKSIYQDKKLLMCPASKIGGKDGAQAWNGWPLGDPAQGAKPLTGSYGENLYSTNPLAGQGGEYTGGEYADTLFWKSSFTKGSNKAPLFMDSACPYMFPKSYEDPPMIPGGQMLPPEGAAIKYPCLDRHGGGTINVLFVDFNVRTVGLKELWTLSWNNYDYAKKMGFDTKNGWTLAGGCTSARWKQKAPWMVKFKAY